MHCISKRSKTTMSLFKFRLGLIEWRTYGKASRRSIFIGSFVISQIPYVPFSIRLIASSISNKTSCSLLVDLKQIPCQKFQSLDLTKKDLSFWLNESLLMDNISPVTRSRKTNNLFNCSFNCLIEKYLFLAIFPRSSTRNIFLMLF